MKSEQVDSQKEILKMVGTVVAVLILFAVWTDWSRYGNTRGCPGTHLNTILKALEQYRLDFHGALPPVGQEEQALSLYVVSDRIFHCVLGPKYEWHRHPADVGKGHYLLVSCPKASHGFIRTFAWGIDIDGGKLRLVRVLNSGQCVPIRIKKKKPEGD